MAEILSGDVKTGRVHAPKFPWDEWLDGQPRRLTRNVDFSPHPVNFRFSVMKNAKQRGIAVRTHISGEDTIDIQAIIPNGKPKKK